MKKNTILMILDGYGINESEKGNAVKLANTPNLDQLTENYPTSIIQASGLHVGLPDGQMGNSEVGHLNIGAGRIVYQELTRITKAIEEKTIFENASLLKAVKSAKDNNSALHLWGLLSDGGVHSHNTHLYALLRLAKENGLEKVYIHPFLDGRDVPPSSAKSYISQLEEKLEEIGIGEIATISGRFYAMDRDNRWERVEMAYNALVLGEGEIASTPIEAVENSYSKDQLDEFVKPTVILKDEVPVATVKENDSIIMFNFRPDRAREITRTFVDSTFNGFERKKGFFKVNYVCMTQYDASMPNVHVAFKPQTLLNTLGEYVSNSGLKQLRIAETEKYAHVTFFFNGGVEEPYKGEDRILIPSPKVATYDMQPEMSANEVTEKLVEQIEKEDYDLIIVNFANPDMVGHTGDIPAAVKAIEAVDICVGKVVDATLKTSGQILITADHGNSDEMLDSNDNVVTAHSTNPVPLVLVKENCNFELKDGKLADLAPTLLSLMNLDKPIEMSGESLLVDMKDLALENA
ncbi:MAG: 2,3-bisphosphoglycerate-independent phosphoglycerate mutase [Anaeromicrobium sp.]|jgi:2,3-bisphosphoglycerate-independent phosphoglycerate mutase|uniref:2,3-bisphosphoglycerate-independent phosphoglycerate mutase n=1 Tax=Anaeromicrobium sp. TaxID=1929132 RepID=UPI0025FB1062|nr:2,3-bisphosphoglycerate-independent phosphoglycerate mutase [Anaeromicrobium sp.]MCT4595813.1 2,3-bisphosphoglycerate-independent phosphoglycerate mutase [Anaeromicrobium sp.]